MNNDIERRNVKIKVISSFLAMDEQLLYVTCLFEGMINQGGAYIISSKSKPDNNNKVSTELRTDYISKCFLFWY